MQEKNHKHNQVGGAKIILIIEDDDALQGVLRDKLKLNGFDVKVASDGKEGLSLIKKEKPDLVILDLMLPEMPGEMVLKKMNENGLIKKVPVIILSVKGDDANMHNCLKVLGARDYLAKSDYTLKEIIDKINKILK